MPASFAHTARVKLRASATTALPDGTLFAAINPADNQPYPYRDSTGQYELIG